VPVLSEISTMTEVAQGTSLARFGHGELAIMKGRDGACQKHQQRLKNELWKVWRQPSCLLGYPHTRGLRGWEWRTFLESYGLELGDAWYGSSFVSRADEVAWTDEYRILLRSLWTGRDVTIIGELGYPQRHSPVSGAISIKCVMPKEQDAFDEIERLEEECNQPRQTTPHKPIVIISCGPTGTVLADRLARKGIWAVDLGNFGKFL